jgi:hypothetical protein
MRAFSGSRHEDEGRLKKPYEFRLHLSASYELNSYDVTHIEVFVSIGKMRCSMECVAYVCMFVRVPLFPVGSHRFLAPPSS